jgi:hypothetical protein
MRSAIFAFLGLAAVFHTPVQGGIFPLQKDKGDKSEQVMKLINQLGDGDAGKRARAAEELRDFDAAEHPEIVIVLIEALKKDPSTSVRREAAQSLGRIKPTSVDALKALEEASDKDISSLVRLQARTARIGYRIKEPKPAASEKPSAKKANEPDNTRIAPVSMPAQPSVQTSKALPRPPAKSTSAKPTVGPSPKEMQEGPILVPPR